MLENKDREKVRKSDMTPLRNEREKFGSADMVNGLRRPVQRLDLGVSYIRNFPGPGIPKPEGWNAVTKKRD